MTGLAEVHMRHDDGLRGAHLGERLNDLLDGDLSPAQEQSALAHLAQCEGCAAEHERLATTLGALRGMGSPRAPRGFASRVLRRAKGQRRTRLRAVHLHRTPVEGAIVVLLAAAAAAVLLGYTFGWGESLFVRTDTVEAAPDRRP